MENDYKNKESASEQPIDAQDFVKHYKNLLQTNTDYTNIDIENEEESISKNPLEFPFTCKEIKQAIVKLKNNKSAGNDLIINEFIKTGSVVLLPKPLWNF